MRNEREEITLDLIRLAMDRRLLGLPMGRLPNSEAKTRIALVAAAKAVALALTPGIPPILYVTISPRQDTLFRIFFFPQVQLVPLPKLFSGLFFIKFSN